LRGEKAVENLFACAVSAARSADDGRKNKEASNAVRIIVFMV